VQALLKGVRELDAHAKTPADSVGPLVVLRCRDAARMVEKLAASDIVCSNRHDGLRLSFHVYNTLDDVEATLLVLGKNRDLLASGPMNGN
jgi:selenocysteine lyase/cysteine desulfurase